MGVKHLLQAWIQGLVCLERLPRESQNPTSYLLYMMLSASQPFPTFLASGVHLQGRNIKTYSFDITSYNGQQPRQKLYTALCWNSVNKSARLLIRITKTVLNSIPQYYSDEPMNYEENKRTGKVWYEHIYIYIYI